MINITLTKQIFDLQNVYFTTWQKTKLLLSMNTKSFVTGFWISTLPLSVSWKEVYHGKQALQQSAGF